MANLEEGELEDGELLSSDEDGEGETASSEKESPSKETVKSETVSESVVIPKLLDLDTSMPLSDNKTNHTSAHSPDQDAKASLNEASVEDGEIFSDDEEAAYYPQHVRSRGPPQAESNWKPSDAEKSDAESPSAAHSGRSLRDRERERERNRRSSSESESDSIPYSRYDTKERGLFFEDREGSGNESTGSRDRMRSRSRERERDRHTSPKYGRNRNRDRDRGSNRSRNDDDSNDHGSHYGRQVGGYGRTKGGYGGYQQRGSYGSPKFQAGGYSNSVQPGLMNTGMTAQQCHHLASKVKKRREDGLPLLPQPNLEKCGNLDQYNYPAPPSWYLEEVDNWEKKEKEEEERKKAMEETNSEERVEQVETKVEESKPAVEERKRPISPLFRRTSSVALEIVSSPVSDGESPMVVAELESEGTDSETSKDFIAPSESNEQSHDLLETMTKPVPSTESAPLLANDTSPIKSLKELAANVVQANTESTTTIAAAVVTTAMATTSIATTDTATTSITTSIATTTTTTTTTANSTVTSTTATPQSSLGLTSSTPDPSSLTHTTKSPTLPPLTLTPLTITNESTATESDDDDHSPSLSPTIPIQSGSQLKRTVSEPSPKPTTFMPTIMSDSGSEGDYDDYLDQLDQEEDDVDTKNNTSLLANTLNEGFPLISQSSAPSLTSLFETGDKAEAATNQILKSSDDPFSEDFPSIGKETKKSSSNQPSLMSLIGQDVTRDHSAEKKAGKSSRRKQKDQAWWTKQKEKEKNKAAVVVAEDLKRATLCKYFLSGNCKNGDSCLYSHNCDVQKKKEICRFYIQGYCNKGHLCSYYHETFPCKYFHTKGYCNNGDQCRFSHVSLTHETKELLVSVLEPPQVAALNASLAVANLPEPSSSVGSLVVSIPKDIVKGLIVSIPLSKLRQGIKHPPANQPASVGIPSGPVPPPQQHQNQPPPGGPFPFQQQPGYSAPSFPSAPSQFGAPPQAPPPNQLQPIPLFPPKNRFQPPPFPPNQDPGPPMPHPPPPHGPHGPPQGQAKKALLPTPPPHMMLVPDDLKKMESHPHDYWEAPELTQQNAPTPYNNAYPQQHPPPPPSMGGAPPQPFNGPPPNQFAQGGFHHQPAPHGPPPPQAQGFPPQQPPQYRHPPPPQQFGPYHGPSCQQQPPPPLFQPTGPHPPQWNEHQGDGIGMRQQPGMEQRPPPPHGVDPRQNQAGLPPSRVDPRQQLPPSQGGGMVQPGIHQTHGWNSDPRRTDVVVEPIGRPTPSNQVHPPPPYEQQQQRSWQQEGGWNPSPQARAHSGPGGQTGGAPYHRHNGGPPPFGGSEPQPNPNMPPTGAPGVAPFHQPPPMAPYQHHNTAPGMLPPHATKYPMPPQQAGGAGQTQAPPPMKDKPSPAWGTSPEYSGSQSPGTGGGSVSPAGDQMRRRDPRTKYAHLKIKSKGGQHTTLKRSADEAGIESSASGFKIPKLLQDSSALNQPMDPGELFGSKDALSGGEEKEYGGITAPFGAFRSMFVPSQPLDAQESGADSAGSTQFGEITMGATASDPAPAKSNENDNEEKSPSDSKSEDKNTEDFISKPSEVPSYLAHLDMGLGSDLKIDSAFGSLSEKSSKNGKSHEGSSGQDSQARKLPSIFGF